MPGARHSPRKPRRSADAGLLYPPSQRELAIRGGLAASATTAPRVFGYVRVSSDAQAEEGQSLAVQMRQLERWAMQRGVTLDGVHVEAGISAGIPFNERPEGGRLWTELRKGDALVAAKLDRMFRSAGDCLAVVETFKARGVSLFLLDLNGGADDVSGNGIARLFLTIVSAFAEFERDRLGERIRATLEPDNACDLRQDGEECRPIRAGAEPEPFSSHAGRRSRAFVRWPDQPTVVRPNHTK